MMGSFSFRQIEMLPPALMDGFSLFFLALTPSSYPPPGDDPRRPVPPHYCLLLPILPSASIVCSPPLLLRPVERTKKKEKLGTPSLFFRETSDITLHLIVKRYSPISCLIVPTFFFCIHSISGWSSYFTGLVYYVTFVSLNKK